MPTTGGKRQWGSVCAGCSPRGVAVRSALPVLLSSVNGKTFRTLVDSGCQQSIVSVDALKAASLRFGGAPTVVTMLDGNTTECLGEVSLQLKVKGRCIDLQCLVSPVLVYGCSIILGMDGISSLGGIYISADSNVTLSKLRDECSEVTVAAGTCQQNGKLQVEDTDFNADFDGEKWTVRWKWKNKEPVLTNKCAQYKILESCREAYDKELEQWIKDGWLEQHDESVHGTVDGVIPLMAAFQPNKQRKVRPVMDYGKELNEYVSCNPGIDVAVCQEKLRSWRQFGNRCCMLDLKKAYLQLHIDKELQKFQAVKHGGRLYVMTRMGFGLNVAPKIMFYHLIVKLTEELIIILTI